MSGTGGRGMIVLEDKVDTILIGVHKGLSIRQMAEELDRAIRTVQDILAIMESGGLISTEKISANKVKRTVTEAGKNRLRRIGVL